MSKTERREDNLHIIHVTIFGSINVASSRKEFCDVEPHNESKCRKEVPHPVSSSANSVVMDGSSWRMRKEGCRIHRPYFCWCGLVTLHRYLSNPEANDIVISSARHFRLWTATIIVLLAREWETHVGTRFDWPLVLTRPTRDQ